MDVRALIDDALEISIVGSFSQFGYRARRRLWGWQDAPNGSLSGKTALITGPTSGLGRATAGELARLGARVVLLGRNRSKLDRVRGELVAATGADRFAVVVVDMSSLVSVRDAVAQVLATERRLDIVVDSAGAIFVDRTETDDGMEATFATMVAGPFVLVSGLLSLLQAGDGGRVISVVSGGMYGQKLDLEDLQFSRGRYNGTLAYARAKRASTALTREWARRLRGGSVRFSSMHPGWVDTPGLRESLPLFYGPLAPPLRTPLEGGDTIIWLATDAHAGLPGGRLHLDRRERPFDRLPSTRLSLADRQRLWRSVVELTGAETL